MSDESIRATAEHEQLEQTLNALRAFVRAVRINTRRVEGQLGLSLAQLYVLQLLAERPVTSLNELADRTFTDQSSVSVVVRRLEDRGLVSRRPSQEDRRRFGFDITDDGRALLARTPDTVQVRLVEAFKAFSADDRRSLSELLTNWFRLGGIDLGDAEHKPPMMGEDE
jgi:DNA-binding MarR family transcriptional regulator